MEQEEQKKGMMTSRTQKEGKLETFNCMYSLLDLFFSITSEKFLLLECRHTDVEKSEAALPHKTVTEPKIIVQTRSEVDLLDDGYRWRKYGQKVVKGNPHPR